MKPVQKIKAKYYSKEILKYLLIAGALSLSGAGGGFAWRLTKNILRGKPIFKRKSFNAFYYLKKKGLISLERDGHDVKISLTKEGKKRAGKYQIDDLFLERPKKWDGKWRLVVFDIPNSSNIIRNTFRRKLKEFGFCLFQKSVWIYPFDCREEIAFLREFFGVDKRQIQVLEVAKIEDDSVLRKIFKL